MRYLWILLLGILLASVVHHVYAIPTPAPERCQTIIVPIGEDEEYEYFTPIIACKKTATS